MNTENNDSDSHDDTIMSSTSSAEYSDSDDYFCNSNLDSSSISILFQDTVTDEIIKHLDVLQLLENFDYISIDVDKYSVIKYVTTYGLYKYMLSGNVNKISVTKIFNPPLIEPETVEFEPIVRTEIINVCFVKYLIVEFISTPNR